MYNILVPIDLSRGQAPFNQRGGPPIGRGKWCGAHRNVAQANNLPPCIREPCFKCGKQGHFTRECHSQTQINYTSYIDNQDNIIGIQPPMSPSNLLSNALTAFDSLPNEQ